MEIPEQGATRPQGSFSFFPSAALRSRTSYALTPETSWLALGTVTFPCDAASRAFYEKGVLSLFSP